MDKQRGDMDMRYSHAAWTCNMDNRHAAKICSMDIQHWHAEWTCKMDVHVGQAAWTCSIVLFNNFIFMLIFMYTQHDHI
jgi:hypothetical protein